jgi:hypothetical protein
MIPLAVAAIFEFLLFAWLKLDLDCLGRLSFHFYFHFVGLAFYMFWDESSKSPSTPFTTTTSTNNNKLAILLI